jgi:glycosyltransferase involved in cell wall biosynthesis
MISIVVPCYNEQEVLPVFYDKILEVLSAMQVEYELIFVDDGSSDATLEIIKKLPVKYISFSRNFGQEAAMLAGLEKASGDYISVINADLQDPLELLPEMYKCVTNEGYDCAAARRVTRKGEPPVRSFFANCFYKLMRTITEVELVDGLREYRMMTRQVLNAVLSLPERNRFSKGIFTWVGFNINYFEFENRERVAGETKWSFFKLLMYSLDAITAFSSLPLHIASFFGLILFLGAVFGIFAGWDGRVCLILFTGSIQLFCTGILGQYLAKTYTETKNRPLFLVKEEN